jgi:glycosyltransferase involved in cell wall biosynthesis
MSYPLVSIVLPTYNGMNYIRQSIDSCLSQTYRNLELIIVNDGSTDGTAEIMAEYARMDDRVVLLHQPYNQKLPSALNAGFDRARGVYFTWTSDDNYYAPHALEKMVSMLQSDPSLDLVYTDYYLINDSNAVTGLRNFGNVYDSFANWLGCGACFLYKSIIHKTNNGYSPSAFLIEDYDFFVRAFIQYRFKYLPVCDTYYYREHKASLTSTRQAAINDISKIFLENNLVSLAAKLPRSEVSLLYRKFAVYFAVQKNNGSKYSEYLGKLYRLSKKEFLVTIVYVPMVKFANTVLIGIRGFSTFFFLLKKVNIGDS